MGFQSQKTTEEEISKDGRPQTGNQSSHVIPILESQRWNSYHKSGHAGRNGMMFSSVKLSSVRCIKFSYGDSISNPRVACRRGSRLSGLCFEFWDTDERVYLGQWFNKLEGETMYLSRDESITEFTVWHSRHLRTASGRGHREMSIYGKVRGVMIETSKGNSKHVQRDSLEDRLLITFGGDNEILVSFFLGTLELSVWLLTG